MDEMRTSAVNEEYKITGTRTPVNLLIEGKCKGREDLFFLENPMEAKNAMPYLRAICDSCPVKDECYDFAMSHMTGKYDIGRYGVWGGTSAKQRIAAHVAKQKAAA